MGLVVGEVVHTFDSLTIRKMGKRSSRSLEKLSVSRFISASARDMRSSLVSKEFRIWVSPIELISLCWFSRTAFNSLAEFRHMQYAKLTGWNIMVRPNLQFLGYDQVVY